MINFKSGYPLVAKIDISSDLVAFNSTYWFDKLSVEVEIPYPTTKEEAFKYLERVTHSFEAVPRFNSEEEYVALANEEIKLFQKSIETMPATNKQYVKRIDGKVLLRVSIIMAEVKH